MTEQPPAAPAVRIRPVGPGDLEPLFQQQADPEASAMAAFPSRDRQAFAAHWQRILADPLVVTRVVEVDGQVVGNVGSWMLDGDRLVGYWMDRSVWGRGVATQALRLLVVEVPWRPLWAHVAVHNVGSVRVLEKTGFTRVGDPVRSPEDDVEEYVYRLDG